MEGRSRRWEVRAVFISMLWLVCISCRKNDSALVVYTSQDQQFAEPILNGFTRATGIRVSAIYDSEAVKTVGLANRLLAEARHPRCDIWWSNEALRTHQLAQRGVFDTNFLAEFGCRTRCIVINTNKLAPAAAPRSVLELTNAGWRGHVALAYPMFGTTSAHFIELRQRWGATNWENWCRALAANKPFLVDGNSAVVKLVGRGEAFVGLTDSDDIRAGERDGLPVAMVPHTPDSLRIPNSIAIVRGAPHRESAERLFQFLSSPDVQGQLAKAGALDEAAACGGDSNVDWGVIARELEPATAALRQIFLR